MRDPYVGEGADGCRRSAAIDRSEADGLDPGPYRDTVLASAAAWEQQAEQLEAAEVVEGELLPAHPEGTPEYAAYQEQLHEELGKWSRGENPYPYPTATPAPEPAEAEVVLSPREEAAQRLVAIAALEQLVKRLKTEHREQAASVYDRAHMKDPVHLDGRELGQVRTDAVKGGWRVADAAAWATYVAKVYPDRMLEQVTTVVDPEMTKQALASVDAETWITLDLDTGEETAGPPPGIEQQPPGHKLVVTAAKDAAQQVTRLLGPAARQLGLPELEADR